jgi:predicted transcriptional regulator
VINRRRALELHKLLEKVFASRAQTRVVQHFLDRPKEFFNLSRIAKDTGLAHSTIHRVMQPLVDIGFVKEIRVGQQIRLFILETEDAKSKIIADFYKQMRPFLEEMPRATS